VLDRTVGWGLARIDVSAHNPIKARLTRLPAIPHHHPHKHNLLAVLPGAYFAGGLE